MPTHADLRAAIRDTHVPCTGDPRWVSENPHERAYAADACHDCPVMLLCRSYADHAGETAGVWGGVDRDRAGRHGPQGVQLSTHEAATVERMLNAGVSRRNIADTLRITESVVRSHIARTNQAPITVDPEERAAVAYHRSLGRTRRDTAARMGITVRRVGHILALLRRDGELTPYQTRAVNLPYQGRVVALREQGLSFTDIATRLGITARQARWAHHRHNKGVAA